MGEFDYISWLRKHSATGPGVEVGIGDDGAVLPAAGTGKWLVTTDMLLEGTHFILADAGPRRVGRKAMAVNLSDIAAMGGRPVAAFVALGLPRQPNVDAKELYLGMREIADEFGVIIAGGDTNSWTGALVVSVTLLGEAGHQGPILRSGAVPGDWLMVTGSLGGSIRGRHLDFTPRVRESLQLQGHAKIHAMIDVSDGLSADVFHLCEQSHCGAVLFADRIPISDAAIRSTDGVSPLDHALGDGEDFELAFAVAPDDGRRLLQTQPVKGINLTHIGAFVAEPALFLDENRQRRRIEPRGYTH